MAFAPRATLVASTPLSLWNDGDRNSFPEPRRHPEGRSVWAYFNNDIMGHAIDDAQTLKSMVGQIDR